MLCETDINYDEFAYRVIIQGGCGFSDYNYELLVFEHFGHLHGDCMFAEGYNSALGRCDYASIDAEQSKDCIYSDKSDPYSMPFLGKYEQYQDQNGNIFRYPEVYEGPWTLLVPLEHCHYGVWTTKWLGKTGYDYGEQVFCFRNEIDAHLFLLIVSDDKNVKYLGYTLNFPELGTSFN